jgi:hypothetical protein
MKHGEKLRKLKKRIYDRKWYIKNRQKRIMQSRTWHKANHKKAILKSRDNYRVHRDDIAEHHRKYYQAHKQDYYKRFKASYPRLAQRLKWRFQHDMHFRLKKLLSCRIRSALKGINKLDTTKNLLGCSIVYLRKYLKEQFKPGMSWDNYGKWHIDHIKPCVSFDLSIPEEQRKCFYYKNLQPLWAKENQSKGGKLCAMVR